MVARRRGERQALELALSWFQCLKTTAAASLSLRRPFVIFCICVAAPRRKELQESLHRLGMRLCSGGTIGGFYWATFHAVNRHPLIAAMVRRDTRVVGNYLRKRDNLFAQMYSEVNTPGFFQALQAAGAIRQDIDAAVIVHIVEMLSYCQLTIANFKALDQFPPYDAVMEALADIMDRALRPEDARIGANSEAGKAIIRQITASARAQMEQIRQTREIRSQGATHDN